MTERRMNDLGGDKVFNSKEFGWAKNKLGGGLASLAMRNY